MYMLCLSMMQGMDEKQVQTWLHDVCMPDAVWEHMRECAGEDLNTMVDNWNTHGTHTHINEQPSYTRTGTSAHACMCIAKELVTSTNISTMTLNALKRKLDKLKGEGYKPAANQDGQVLPNVNRSHDVETMSVTPGSKGSTTSYNLSEEVRDTNEKTISEWTKELNKLIMEHNKQFSTNEAITLMKFGPNRITMYCEVCGSTGMVLDQQATKPFKNLFNQHILRGRNHLYQYNQEHGVEPQYVSKKEREVP